MTRFRERPVWLERIVDLIYPKTAVCMGCDSSAGHEGDWLCEDCRRSLARHWVGAHPESTLDGLAAAYYYHGPAGGMVRNLKFRGVADLAEPMVRDMLRAYEQIQPTGAEVVVAVPMHPKRLRERGINHSQILAQGIAEALLLPYQDALVRTRNTEQQSMLDDEARRKNLEDAFRADDRVYGKRVLLVDDVYTTGETARQCASALREAGARTVSVLTYALGKQ